MSDVKQPRGKWVKADPEQPPTVAFRTLAADLTQIVFNRAPDAVTWSRWCTPGYTKPDAVITHWCPIEPAPPLPEPEWTHYAVDVGEFDWIDVLRCNELDVVHKDLPDSVDRYLRKALDALAREQAERDAFDARKRGL